MGAVDEGVESDADDEGMKGEVVGQECERIGLAKEDEGFKRLLDPKLPTEQEVEDHYMGGHLPYRNWCPVCVRAKGKEMNHNQGGDKVRKLPEYSWDYCFPGDELGFKWTVLVGRERASKSWMATAVPTKGASGKFSVDKCLEFIDENGDRENRIVVKTDQEPSIQYLINDLVSDRSEGGTVVEESPVKNSSSNGVVERGVQEVEGQIRALFLGLQERLGRRIDARERIVAFIPEYAAYLMNRRMVGEDGKVAYERVKGKKPTLLGVEFGEKLFYKVKLNSKLEKMNTRWEYGIFVGVRRRSNEVMVATREGVIFVRSVKRVPVEHRWGEDNVQWVKWAPWRRYREAEDADGEVPEGVPAEEVAGSSGSKVVFVRTKEVAPREFYISKKDAEKFGHTRGCGGCSSWARGLSRQPHTEACRERFRGLMNEDAKVQHAARKRKEFEDREEERKKRKEEKREARKRKAEDGGEDPRVVQESEVPVSGGGGVVSMAGAVVEESELNRVEEDVEEKFECKEVVIGLVEQWIQEIEGVKWEEVECEEVVGAWDDVHGGELPLEKVKEARSEEVEFMQLRGIWDVVPVGECWEKLGKAPVSVRWVDTNKGGLWEMIVRSRLVARDFKGKDGGRDDLFAETPPLEANRILFSRAVTRRRDGRYRKLMFVDARKAHLNPRCEEDVYIELPEECGAPAGMCGKLNFWLYGFRKAASAWEQHYAELFEGVGFVRGITCGVVFYHEERDVAVVVHGDDFTMCGLEEDLMWVKDLMSGWFEIKLRGVLGPDPEDDKEIVILGRTVKWTSGGIEYEADPRHRIKLLEYFGFEENSRVLSCNGQREDRVEEWEEEDLSKEEGTEYRGLAARLNFLSLDCPDLQFAIKPCSRDMASPKRGSWSRIKKMVRYLIGCKRVVWEFKWQDEPRFCHVASDSDWGGTSRDRRSTSGGVWMLGDHCIKTWSVSQGAYALSSAEAELYGMVEAVTRAKGLLNLAVELGFRELSNVVHLGTDSSAAKSFVCRRGLGRMRHLEIKDLWLQKEVREGKVEVCKIPGEENPADLMTKVLSAGDIDKRLRGMNIRAERV